MGLDIKAVEARMAEQSKQDLAFMQNLKEE